MLGMGFVMILGYGRSIVEFATTVWVILACI